MDTMTLDGKTYSVVGRCHVYINLRGKRGAKYALTKNLRHGYWVLTGRGGKELGQFGHFQIALATNAEG